MDVFSDSLDEPLGDFSERLGQCVDLIVAHYRTIGDLPGHPGNDEREVRSWFDEPLPELGLDVAAVLDEVDDKLVRCPTNNVGTRMFAYVMSGGTQVSVMADLIMSALDQNPAKWHLGPSATEIEKRVISWGAEFVGLEPEHAGTIVSGGSAANLTGLTVGRNLLRSVDARKRGLFNQTPLITYASTQTHSSIEKSIEVLGLGTDNLRKIPTSDDFTINLDALKKQIECDRRAGLTPFCIVGNAGTVNTGAIDPLSELAKIAESGNLWFHVDGAYGGLASALPELRHLYDGLERADSIALDFHKWLYQPFEIGVTLVKSYPQLQATFDKRVEYLEFGAGDERFDISRHSFSLSRNAKALKVWMSFKAYGAEAMRRMIRKDIELTKYLGSKLGEEPEFELVTSEPLGICCFRYTPANIVDDDKLNRFNERLIANLETDGRVFITGTELADKKLLRACIINHRMQQADIDYLINTIKEVAIRTR